jgi:deoxycytidylate deaminase
MSAKAKKVIPINDQRDLVSESSMEQFQGRESKELIIGFIGPIGCGLAKVISDAEQILQSTGYKVVRIKISNLLDEEIDGGSCSVGEYKGFSSTFRRYNRLQDAGKELRLTLGTGCLAEYAMQEISLHRLGECTKDSQITGGVPSRVAYLIDQLKHPDEVEILRAVYRKLFYLIGTTSFKLQRESFFAEQGMGVDEVKDLIERDRREDEQAGQQLEKALKLADLYVRNKFGNGTSSSALTRFFELVHGTKIHTPTREEHGMYLAHAAGVKSACLSRQVGAAVFSKDWEIVATGCNDVPQGGGGLYGTDARTDMRCYAHGGHCRNVEHKGKIHDRIRDELRDLRNDPNLNLSGVTDEQLIAVTERIFKRSGVENLLEFSRSVHAEMDAIVSAARNGSKAISGGYLFSTTYPCHSCARHIVAAGISEVFFIEPYEKSLALTLHGDAISFDIEQANITGPNKVRFSHFEGVSPRTYVQLFQQHAERKGKDGRYAPSLAMGGKKIPEYLDAYFDFEARAVQGFKERVVELRAKSKLQ